MPIRITKTTSENYNQWKQYFSEYVDYIEEVESKYFIGTKMPNVGIYNFSKNEKSEITIKLLNKDVQKIKSLTEISELQNDYEEEILSTLFTEQRIPIFNLKIQGGKVAEKADRVALRHEYTNKLLQPYPNKWLLSVSICGSNPRRKTDPQYFTTQNGQIMHSNSKEYIYNHWCNRDVGALKFMCFDTMLAAQRCKEAMKRPLLRWTLFKMQDD